MFYLPELFFLFSMSVCLVAMYVMYSKQQTANTKHQIPEDIEKTREKILDQAHKKAQKIIASAKAKAIQSMANTQVDLDSKLERVAVATSRKIEDNLLNQAQEAINQYKAQKLREIDEKVETVLTKTIKTSVEEILGKNITMAEHRELIFNALDKAKKDHVL